MASTDSLTMGVDQYYTGNHGRSRDTRVIMASTDTLTRGLQEYILVILDGAGITE